MRNNQLKVGIILSYFSMIISTLISIIYTPFMLSTLGQGEYGVYSLASSIISYLSLFSLGFGSAYVKFYMKYKVKKDENAISTLNGMFITLFLIISILCLICGLFLSSNLDIYMGSSLSYNELLLTKKLMKILVFNIALTFPLSVFESYVTANEQYFFQRIMTLFRAILNPFLAVILLISGFRSVGIVIASLTVTLFAFIINILFCIKHLNMKFKFYNFDWSLFKEISSFSFFIFLNMVTDQINWAADKFILGRYVGSVAVTVYSIGGQLNTYFMNISTTVSSVFIPKVNRMIVSNASANELTLLLIKVGRVQLLILAYIYFGFIGLGKYFISIWAGTGNHSYTVALLLMGAAIIPLIQNVGIEIQRAKNMHHFRSLLYFIIAIFNILLSVILVKIYGENGVAIGTTLSLLIGNGLVMNIYYQKKIGLNMRWYWNEILGLCKGLIIPLTFSILIMNLKIGTLYSFVLLGVTYSVIFFLSVWNLGMNSFEKGLVLKSLNILRLKIIN